MDLWVIFLTGLTTGGLTCLAIQGGLLATALAKQVPVAVPPRPSTKGRKQAQENILTSVQLTKNPWPVVYFLTAKLIAYTLLGFLLGTLGSVFQLSLTVQAIMQIVAGLFMLATALNMLNVHPIFRYAAIQPPKAITRSIRNQAKSQEVFTPALLGALTIFIPCGTTQAMEILAISSGSPLMGALIMFAFVLGTSPTFFVLGFLATKIRGQFQPVFALVTAILILFLGIVSLDGGLSLLDSPLAPSNVLSAVFTSGGERPISGEVQTANGFQELSIKVLNSSYDGYTPNRFTVHSGQPIRLRLITNNSFGCARSFTIPRLGIRRLLPTTGETIIDLPAQQVGTLPFSCSMGMSRGLIIIS
jgi:uncharacterized protein